MVDGSGFENRRRGNSTGGSNPSASADSGAQLVVYKSIFIASYHHTLGVK